MRSELAFASIFLVASNAYPDDVICYRNWYLENPRPAPRRCPPTDFFSYYECCGDSDNCCRRMRIELLIFLFVPLCVLIAVLCCCTFFSLLRKPKRHVDDHPEGPQLSRDERECHYFY
ncbi:hypothetical protein Q1695_016286 [Nippostrongylus brasiliensis]|nr:hypothetical protein Q1695_016286 [Nippostrongylus brasiliensis]